MNLDEAWIKVGEACYAHEDKSARYALMLVRADMGEKNHILKMLKWQLTSIPQNAVDIEQNAEGE